MLMTYLQIKLIMGFRQFPHNATFMRTNYGNINEMRCQYSFLMKRPPQTCHATNLSILGHINQVWNVFGSTKLSTRISMIEISGL